jgi:hypothetical protein
MFKNVDLKNVKNWANERFFNNDPRLPLSTPNTDYDLFCRWIDTYNESRSEGEDQLRDSDIAGIFYRHFEELNEKGLIQTYLK